MDERLGFIYYSDSESVNSSNSFGTYTIYHDIQWWKLSEYFINLAVL